MMKRANKFVAMVAALGAAAPAMAESQPRNGTSIAAEKERPAATMAEMKWLEGQWIGTGIGGNPAGEAFSYAGNGQMVGHFWQLDDAGAVQFYELITITQDGDSLVMRLKHFNADLAGWETKAAGTAVVFPLQERTQNRWRFGAATFTKDGPDKLNVSVVIRQDDGMLGSLDFKYTRVPSG